MTTTEAPPERAELVPIHPSVPTPRTTQPVREGIIVRPSDTNPDAFQRTTEQFAATMAQPDDVRPQELWRRILHKPASAATLDEAHAQTVMRGALIEPVRITVAGPNADLRTLASIGLASAIAAARGGNVALLDNEQGSIGDRTLRDDHNNTAADLLNTADWWASPHSNAVELGWHAHPQPVGVHVFGSDNRADPTTATTAEEHRAIAAILRRWYSVTVTDAGGSEAVPRWRASIADAHAIVVPVRGIIADLLPASRMLEGLTSRGHDLAGRVTLLLVGAVSPEADQAASDWFTGASIVRVPGERRLQTNRKRFTSTAEPIVWDRLPGRARSAFNRVGATVMCGIRDRRIATQPALIDEAA